MVRFGVAWADLEGPLVVDDGVPFIEADFRATVLPALRGNRLKNNIRKMKLDFIMASNLWEGLSENANRIRKEPARHKSGNGL